MLSVITCTARETAGLDWIADGLAREAETTDLEWIVVDRILWGSADVVEARRQYVERCVGRRFQVTHLPPKPTVWQGPHRLTSRDLFALANARNTALIVARGSRLVCIDDLSAVPPGWAKYHAQPFAIDVCIAGSFDQYGADARVVDGWIASGVRQIHGTEWRRKRWTERSKIRGGFALGANTSYPIDALLTVDGWCEAYDGQWGFEDADLGVRIERAGWLFYYEPSCTHALLQGHQVVRWQGIEAKANIGGEILDANALHLEELTKDSKRTLPRERNFISDIRYGYFAQGDLLTKPPRPLTHDWRTGKPLSEL